jgi:glycosyltransferase involved in cell wall biosynthesis
VIIVGNGSVDDPSGATLYEEMLKLRQERYADDKQGIIIMRLKHNYTAINALMYHSQSNDKISEIVAMQPSEAEGCETRISDWIKHGVPVVVSNRGGMSLQVVVGKSGLVLDYNKSDYDLDGGVDYIYELMTDYDKYTQSRRDTLEIAKEYNNREFSTTANATRLARVLNNVLAGKAADKVWKISDLTDLYSD